MLYSFYRMINYHPWARPSHHRPHLLTHVRLITMNRAFLAGRLLIAELAPIQTGLGITQQLRTVLTKLLVTFISSAVEPNHHPYRPLLALYVCFSFHRRKSNDFCLIQICPSNWEGYKKGKLTHRHYIIA